MEADGSTQVDALADWAEATSRAMSGRTTSFKPVEEALPGLAAQLHSVARAALEQALGRRLKAEEQVRIQFTPERISVSLEGYGTCETETGVTIESLEELVFSASYSLVEGAVDY